jgi:hypothetical protein
MFASLCPGHYGVSELCGSSQSGFSALCGKTRRAAYLDRVVLLPELTRHLQQQRTHIPNRPSTLVPGTQPT